MDRLRPRERQVFNGFTGAEVEKLEKLFDEMGEQSLSRDFCLRTAQSFRSSGRAGKPVVRWNEVQDWFQDRQKYQPKGDSPTVLQKETTPPDASKHGHTDTCTQRRASEDSDVNAHKRANEHPKCNVQKKEHEPNQVAKATERGPDLSELEFEARSSRDGAWYDVERFLTHRILSSGEAEVRVRFVGFGAEEDEWVNVKKSVRERSIPLEHWECQSVKAGDVLLCLQERKDQAIYYDVHVVDVQRKMHDIRGCRCIFLVCYDHDKTEERVRLRRLCRQP